MSTMPTACIETPMMLSVSMLNSSCTYGLTNNFEQVVVETVPLQCDEYYANSVH